MSRIAPQPLRQGTNDSTTKVSLWRKVEKKMSDKGEAKFEVPNKPWPRSRDAKVMWMLERLQVKDEALQLRRSSSSWCRGPRGEGDGRFEARELQELVDIVVQSAAKYGHEKALRWLWDGGLWDPTDDADAKAAIDAADSEDQMMTLLGVFDMRVQGSMAHAYADCLIKEVEKLKSPNLDDLRRMSQHHRPSPSSTRPSSPVRIFPSRSPVATSLTEMRSSRSVSRRWKNSPSLLSPLLVANFIKVAHLLKVHDVLKFMDALVENQQFLLVASDDKKTLDVDVTVLQERMNFPEHLGTIFVWRNIKFNQALYKPTEDRDKGEVSLDGEEQVASTSKLSPITLPPDARMRALIPSRAVNFAFVYNCEWLPSGGYLYLDEEDKTVALNPISFNPDDHVHAFGFGDAIDSSPDQIESDVDVKENGWAEVTVDTLRQKGAKYYKWVEPQPADSDFPLGGFAYLFDDGSQRFFPLISSGELIKRGAAGREMNAAELHGSEQADKDLKVLQPIISWSYFDSIMGALRLRPISFHGLLSGKILSSVEHAATHGYPVKFARVLVSAPLHPSLLHAVAITQCKPVVYSRAAKAIVEAAFRAIMPMFARDICVELVTFLSLWVVISGLRYDFAESDAYPLIRLPLQAQLCLGFLISVNLWTILVELVVFKEYVLRGWFWLYFSLWRNITIVNVLVSMAIFVFSWSRQSLTIVTAWAFSLRLLNVVSFTLAMETCSFGRGIAPIVKSLIACATFFSIVVCMLLVFACLFWGLSDTHKTGDNVAVAMYRLGFLSDFDMDDDVTTSSTETIQMWEILAFFLVTIIVSVALMNIFIGMFTTYYDHYLERATELFMKTRAGICVAYALRRDGLCKLLRRSRSDSEGSSRDVSKGTWSSRTVWLCYRDVGEGRGRTDEVSMRAQFEDNRDRIDQLCALCAGLDQRVTGLDQRVKDNHDNIDKMCDLFERLDQRVKDNHDRIDKMCASFVGSDQTLGDEGRSKNLESQATGHHDRINDTLKDVQARFEEFAQEMKEALLHPKLN